MASRPWRRTGTGVEIAVRLTPRAQRDCLNGALTLSDGHPVLAARVRAAPEGGQANAAALRLVAQALDVAASDCTLASGAKSRLKLVAVAGDADRLERALEALCQDASQECAPSSNSHPKAGRMT